MPISPTRDITTSHFTLPSGSSQIQVRDHNERLVLSLIRRNGSMSKAGIARAAGFSAQTATVIMRALEKEDLLLRDAPVRGKVGQPSVPMRLNPQGAYSVGLKVGRRSADLVLMDFTGNIVDRLHAAYSFPDTVQVVEFASNGVKQLIDSLPKKLRHRVCGIGIAIPFGLWKWGAQVGAPRERMAAWRGFDLKQAIRDATGLETYLENDATAGCGAEHLLGRGQEFDNFCYLYIGFFIGGGIVLNGHVVSGPTGNAGSFGAMPVDRLGPDVVTLIDRASVFVLENMLLERGVDPDILWKHPDNWGDLGEALYFWIDQVAESLATAIIATCSVIDFSAVLIDGGCPDNVRMEIVTTTLAKLDRLDLTGIQRPEIHAGSIGPNAPAMGGAILPIANRFFIKPETAYN